MKLIKNAFGNLFLSPQISLANLVAFTTDLIERLSASNPDQQLDGQIAALSEALAELNHKSTADFAMLGIRKGGKFKKNQFRRTLRKSIHRIYCLAAAEFGDNSEELKNIFPKGRSIFNSIRDDLLTEPLAAMISGLSRHESKLGPNLTAEAEALRSRWIQIHDSSVQATGKKAATEEECRQARESLARELYRTAGLLMMLFPDDPERFSRYMQQHLLSSPTRNSETADQEEVQSEPKSTENAPDQGRSTPAPVAIHTTSPGAVPFPVFSSQSGCPANSQAVSNDATLKLRPIIDG